MIRYDFQRCQAGAGGIIGEPIQYRRRVLAQRYATAFSVAFLEAAPTAQAA
jgi:hypothetical protein